MTDRELPGFEDVQDAARRLGSMAVRTPLLHSSQLDELVGRRILIKPECLQRTGSFKFRGAYNRISRLDPERNSAGVVAYSSGNHAQGVAAAAKIVGVPAVIVMPEDTPRLKIENTRSYGAEVVLYPRDGADRQAIAEGIAAESGALVVPPFDDPFIIAGQGTAGLELVEDSAARGSKLDSLVVPAGGGGLIAGINLAVSQMSPQTRVYSAEPEGFDDHARSLKSGTRERNARTSGSICDALLSPEPGEMTFAINGNALSGGLAVSDAEVRAAVAFAWRNLKLVVEPGGAVALAAVMCGKIEVADTTTAIVLSGGNVDAALYEEMIGKGWPPRFM